MAGAERAGPRGECGPFRGTARCARSAPATPPHTLTQRPLVDSTHKVFDIVPRGADASVVLVVDGQVQVPMSPGDRVTVRRGDSPFPLVRLPGHSFYRTLRDKLGWGTVPPGDRGFAAEG